MSSAGPLTFSPFPRLPPELRHEIWTAALPESINPAAFLLKRDCWKWWENDDHEEEVRPQFQMELLTPVPLKIPLFSACREARLVVLAWLRKVQGVSIDEDKQKLSIENNENHAISSSFDPMRDVLYITWNNLPGFSADADFSRRSLERDGYLAEEPLSPIKKIAIHADTLSDGHDHSQLGRALDDWFQAVEEVYMTIDFEDEKRYAATSTQDRWEFEPLPIKDDLTQSEIRKRWPVPKTFYQRAEEARVLISNRLSEPQSRRLKVRPMYIRKR